MHIRLRKMLPRFIYTSSPIKRPRVIWENGFTYEGQWQNIANHTAANWGEKIGQVKEKRGGETQPLPTSANSELLFFSVCGLRMAIQYCNKRIEWDAAS